MGSQTEEGGDLTSQEEVVEVEAVEVGKKLLSVTGMTTTISALILHPLVPAGKQSKPANPLSDVEFIALIVFTS